MPKSNFLKRDFPQILSLKSFDGSWGNWYTKFAILDNSCLFTCCELDPYQSIAKFQNIMIRIVAENLFMPMFYILWQMLEDVKRDVLKNLGKFTGKHMYWSLFFNEVNELIASAMIFLVKWSQIFKRKNVTPIKRARASR